MSTYTPEQLQKRDESKWTLVQAILAPVQFLAFVISFVLVVRYLLSGQGYAAATVSVLIKIALLWLITITGMIWEKEVFGRWFLAPEFFWEDVGNAVAMIMHNLYFFARWQGWTSEATMTLMLVAYIAYLFNMAQFIVKGVRARKDRMEGAVQAQQSG